MLIFADILSSTILFAVPLLLVALGGATLFVSDVTQFEKI